MIDKTDILKLQDLPIESVADALGLEVRRHKCLCPFHDDSHPSLTFSTSRNRYRCYVCDARGGTIDLVMNYSHLSFYDACLWLAKEFDIYLPDVGVREVRVESKVRVVKKKSYSLHTSAIDLHYLEGLVAHPYLSPEAEAFLYGERHLDPRVIRWLGLSSISSPVPMSGNPNGTWFNAPSLLIPYRDINGKLLSVQARYLGTEKDKPRFQFPKGSKCSIYNLPVLKLLHPDEPLFIAEGCSDAWSLLSAGHKAIAIPSATLLQESDLKVLEKHVVHIYPDKDKAGEALYNRLVDASIHIGFTLVRHQLPMGCKDFSDYYLLNVKC
jgi:DNA primase